jgi:RecB family exonuclease
LPSHAVLGPLRALEQRFVAAVRAEKEADPLAKVVVVVRSNLLALHLRRWLAKELGQVGNLRFLTLLDAAREVAPGRGPAASPALERYALELSAHHMGDVRARPERVAEALQATAEDLAEARVPLAALPGMEDRLAAALGDARDRLAGIPTRRQIFEASLSAPLPPSLSRPLIYGFYDLTDLQWALVERLARAGEARLFVPDPALQERHGAVRLLEERLIAAGVELERLNARPTAPATLLREDRPQPGRPASAPPVRLISCADRASEARLVARKVVALARDGVKLQDITVVYRGDPEAGQVLREAFAAAEVPAYLPAGRPAVASAAGQQALALLRVLAGDLTRPAVMELLTVGPLSRRMWEEGVRPAAWDSLVRKALVVGARARDGELPGDWRPRLQAKVAEIDGRLEVLEDDDPARARLEAERGRAQDVLRFVEDLAARLPGGGVERFGTWAKQFHDAAHHVFARSDDLDRVLEKVSDLADLDRLGVPVGFARFAVDARAVIEAESFQDNRLHGGVLISDAHTARGLICRHLFLTGLSEGAFPVHGRPDPLLLEQKRRHLNESGGYHLPLVEGRPADEEFLFLLLLDSASDAIHLSMPRREGPQQRATLPSTFLLRAAELRAGRALDSQELRSLSVDGEKLVEFVTASEFAPGDPFAAATEREFDVAAIRAGLEHHGTLHGALQATWPAYEHGRQAMRHRQLDVFTEFDGILTDPRARGLGAALIGRPFSATSLQEYALCPHKFFLNRVLRVEEFEEPELTRTMGALERGSFVHAILEQFNRALIEWPAGRELEQSDAQAALDRAVELQANVGPATSMPGRDVIWELEVSEVAEDLRRWLGFEWNRIEDGWLPIKAETALSPTTIDLPSGQRIALSGRIDALYRSVTGALRLVDYKTGAKPPKDNMLGGGDHLQLPLYVLAEEASGIGVIEEAQYVYPTRKANFATAQFSAEALEERRAELLGVLDRIVEGIRDGFFHVHPELRQMGHCDWCPYKRACPAKVRGAEKLEKDDNVGWFREMRQVP